MDETLASPSLNRLLHHAHVIVAQGESIRLEDALNGKGGGAPTEMPGKIPDRPWGIPMAASGDNTRPPTGKPPDHQQGNSHGH